jgi:hypothetical protein
VYEKQRRYVGLTGLHSKAQKYASLFPGSNYGAFQAFLESTPRSGHPSVVSATQLKRSFLFVHTLPMRPASAHSSPQQQQQQQQPQMQNERSLYKLAQGVALSPISPLPCPEPNSRQIVFMRGFATAEWVKALGSFYLIDPEYFRRHLDFLSITNSRYDIPPLPSAIFGIIRLRVTDIFTREASLDKNNVQDRRRDEFRGLRTYQNSLGRTAVSGETIVRRYSIHDGATFSTEHDISIIVRKSHTTPNSWIGGSALIMRLQLDSIPPLYTLHRTHY